jgi:uncharacterized protein (TIGR02391 family)
MDLEGKVDERLWVAVGLSFESRNFTASIRDAIHLMSDAIRERSGLDSDGVQLAGDAFGGKAPKLKIGRLATETEQSIQRGVEALLRGTYMALRNPRSHGVTNDTEADAITIILFINHLLKIIGATQAPFVLATFVTRVLDPGFVPKDEYAELLVGQIPEKQRLNVCAEVFRSWGNGDPRKLLYFFRALLKVMCADDKGEFIRMVSDDLTTSDDERQIRTVIQVLPSSLWQELDKIARLRIEHKLVESVRDGKYVRALNRCQSGSLGTWADSIVEFMSLKNDLRSALVTKLASQDPHSQDYVFRYFSGTLPQIEDSPGPYISSIVRGGLKAGDVRFRDMVTLWKSADDFRPDSKWGATFTPDLEQFKEAHPAADEDIPF